MVPAEHHGIASPSRASCVTRLCPWRPHGPWPPCLQGFGGSGEGGLCLQAEYQDQIVDRRHCSAQQPAPRTLCGPLSLCSPLHSGSPHPGPSLPLFIIGSLGKAAWLLSSQTGPSWRGRDGTTSFSRFAPSQSVELRFPVDQASSVKSPLWKSQSPQPSAASAGKLSPPTPTPFGLFTALGQSHGEMGWRKSLSSRRWLHLLVQGVIETPVPCTASLHWWAPYRPLRLSWPQ